MIQIVTIKWGTKYGPEYVNRLFVAVKRNVTFPAVFTCLTDDPQGIEAWIQTMPLGFGLEGWWNKLALFHVSFPTDLRRIIWMDLDTVITGDIDFLACYRGDFAMLRDFYYPTEAATGIMLLRAGVYPGIWKDFIETRPEAKFHSDQEFICDWLRRNNRTVDIIQDIFPGRIVSYKADCQGQGLPDKARIVCFHGDPKPHQVKDDFIREHWHG